MYILNKVMFKKNFLLLKLHLILFTKNLNLLIKYRSNIPKNGLCIECFVFRPVVRKINNTYHCIGGLK